MQEATQKKRVMIIAAAGLLIVLVLAVVIVSITKPSSSSTQPATPSAKTSQTGQSQQTSPTALGSSGVYQPQQNAFTASPPAGWTTHDETAKHQATWITYTKGKAFIVVNQETHGNSLCVFPGDTDLPKESDMQTADIEDLDTPVEVKTTTGDIVRVAKQQDDPSITYVCEKGYAPDGIHYGTLTSIGHVMLFNPDGDPAIATDFISFMKSVGISKSQ